MHPLAQRRMRMAAARMLPGQIGARHVTLAAVARQRVHIVS